MALDQYRSSTKASGGRRRRAKGKRLHALAREPSMTKLAPRKNKTSRTIGGNSKTRLLQEETANLFDAKTKKYVKAKILTILENPANRHFVRRNIMTKGTIINTDKGKAKITSRPGQDGSVNAVLI